MNALHTQWLPIAKEKAREMVDREGIHGVTFTMSLINECNHITTLRYHWDEVLPHWYLRIKLGATFSTSLIG